MEGTEDLAAQAMDAAEAEHPGQSFTEHENEYVAAAYHAMLGGSVVIPIKTTLTFGLGFEDEPVIVWCAQVKDDDFVPFAILLNNDKLAALLNTPDGIERIDNEPEAE